MNPILELNGISHRYGSKPVLSHLSLCLNRGTIGCLLGPSGSGKTTVLRTIAGFEDVSAGEVRINGETVSRPGWSRVPRERKIGIVFQDYALFPHLSVEENIALGLSGTRRRDREARIHHWLEVTHLMPLKKSYHYHLFF